MTEDQNEKPPVFSTWGKWYWFVMFVLAAQIVVYFLITNSFR